MNANDDLKKILVTNDPVPCVIVIQDDNLMEHILCDDGKTAEEMFLNTFKHYADSPDVDDKEKEMMLDNGRAKIPNGMMFLSWAM